VKNLLVLIICLSILQTACAAEIRPGDIEYRYEGMAAAGSLSSSFLIREPETKRIKLTRKITVPLAIKLSQPESDKPPQEIRLAENQNKATADQAGPINPVEMTAATAAPVKEKENCPASCKKNIVFFPLNGSSIEHSEMDQIKQFINTLKGKEVKVTGFTCKIGSKAYNTELANNRAQNVARYLRQEGVVVSQIRGIGQQDYISSVDHLNRRVEIELQ